MSELDIVLAAGKKFGIDEALSIYTSKIDVKEWVRLKCQFGCKHFGKNYSCPPLGIDLEKSRKLLMEYKRAILIIGEDGKMDLKKFREGILEIERTLVLNNFPRAFAMIMGPCNFCEKCTLLEGKPCRYPELKRPSLEGTGIDIVSTIKRNTKKNIDLVVKERQFPSFAIILLE